MSCSASCAPAWVTLAESDFALVPKLQLGNAVLEALLRHPASDTLHTALARRWPASALRQVRTYKPAGLGVRGFGKRSFQSVRSQAGAWERERFGTRAKLGNKFNALLSRHGHTRQV